MLAGSTSHRDLLLRVGAFPDVLPRTLALEQRIRIGAGFHGKWYASQGEHWRAWMGYHDAVLRRNGTDPDSVPASIRWRLHCLPMMFWLGEAAGVSDDVLNLAEEAAEIAAAKIPHDSPAHGKAMRAVLPWSIVENALSKLEPLSGLAVAAAEASVKHAHDKLVATRGARYR